ncbi:MAG: ROK family transcriptional regulator [Pseudomonadota bacterium]
MKLKGDQQTSRAMNRRLILNMLRRSGPTSRAEIAILSGLSPAAVTFVITDLIEEGLVIEGEASKGTGGRKPIPVAINYASRLTIGFKLNAVGLEAVLSDLSTTPIETIFQPIPDTRPETVVCHAAEIVRRLMPDAKHRARNLIGIGLALPGSYDVETGICTVLARFGWHNVPIAEMLANEVDVPVWVDNDVNSFALAQHLFGQGQQHDQMMALAIGAGIGASFLTNGIVHRGANGAAGEIGHTIVTPGGLRCECGRQGCMQAYWSESALTANWAAHCAAAPDAIVDLAAAADADDPAALALLRDAGLGIGTVLASVVNVVDPDIIIVGGEGVRFGAHLRDPIAEAMRKLAFKSSPEIVFDWQHNSWPRGAAALAVQRFFNFESRKGQVAG